MANLKGSRFDKQIRDARIRMDARHTSRHTQKEKHLAHSHAVLKQREAMLRDFAKHLQEKGITEGKLNNLMTDENLQSFFKSRTMNLSASSAETYISGFNGMLKGLKSANISIDADHDKIAKEFTKDLQREIKNREITTGRYISNSEYLAGLQKLSPHICATTRLQYEYGFRSSEAVKIANNPSKYIKNDKIVGVVGKGKRIYKPKRIDSKLKEQLQQNTKRISINAYQKAVKSAMGHRAHDLRLSYAKNKIDSLVKIGENKITAMRSVAEELNHSRLEISRYYLARA